jgi:hypothetical protein
VAPSPPPSGIEITGMPVALKSPGASWGKGAPTKDTGTMLFKVKLTVLITLS